MCSVVKNENLDMPEINRNLSKWNKHPVLTINITGNCLNVTNLLFQYHFGFNNKKSYFQASMIGFLDNFE